MTSLRLVWTGPALRGLVRVADYIAEANPEAARHLVARARTTVRRLKRHPQSGRVVPEFGDPAIREIIQPPLRIIYRAEEGLITIVAVYRSEQSLPEVEET